MIVFFAFSGRFLFWIWYNELIENGFVNRRFVERTFYG